MTEQHKQDIIALIQAGKKLPKHLIYELFADNEEDVFLFWNGRREDTTNIALPFHSISNEGDLVADFFCGSGTTAAVAEKLGRNPGHYGGGCAGV